jgi:hypothetical protein
VLKDVTKLESDFLYCFTPLENEAELAEGMLITNLLIGVRYSHIPGIHSSFGQSNRRTT